MSAPSEFPKHGEVRRTVLEEPAPAFSTAQAEEIAERAFELRASAHPLASERDQNFRVIRVPFSVLSCILIEQNHPHPRTLP